MGKGSGGCVERPAVLLGGVPEQDTPGRSNRAQETFRLLQEAGNFPQAYLLRDLQSPQQTIAPAKADAPDFAYNAFMHWVPSSFHGHAGYVPEHEQLRQELLYAVLLDGDRRSNHLYFYKDKRMNGVWTWGSAAAVRGWYRLPHDGEGFLAAQGLGQTIQASMFHPRGSFLSALRDQPIQTLAQCVDVHESDVDLQALAPRMAQFSPVCQKAVWKSLTRTESIPDAPLQHLKIRTVLDISEAEGLSIEQQELLLQAAALLPTWGVPVDSEAATSPAVQELLNQVQPQQSADGFTMLAPTTTLGKVLADAQQSWMASSWCDWGIYQWQLRNNIPDDTAALEYMRQSIPRTPWWTKHGRETMTRPAKLQETRIRSLIGLSHGGMKLPPAPKGWKKLQL